MAELQRIFGQEPRSAAVQFVSPSGIDPPRPGLYLTGEKCATLARALRPVAEHLRISPPKDPYLSFGAGGLMGLTMLLEEVAGLDQSGGSG